MADGDADFKIRISTAADLDGADAAAQSLEALKEKTEGVEAASGGAEKGLRRMIEEAGTIREAQRIAQGFFDVFLGGGRSIQGTAEIMRFFIATAADINPIFATLAVLGASIAVVAGRQEEHKKAITDTSDASDALTKTLEANQKRIGNTIDEELRQRKLLEDSYERQAQFAERTAAAAVKAMDIQGKINDALLEGQRLTELAANKGGAEGEEAINEKYAGLKAQGDERVKLDENAVKTNSKEGELESAGAQYQTISDLAAPDRQRLKDLQANRDKTTAYAKALGIAPDEKGSFQAAFSDLVKQNDAAKAKALNAKEHVDNYNALDAVSRFEVDPTGGAGAILNRDAGTAQNEFTWTSQLRRAGAAAYEAQSAYDNPDTGYNATQKRIDDTNSKLDSLKEKETSLAQDIQDLQQQRHLIIYDSQNAAFKAAQDNKAARQDLGDRSAKATTAAGVEAAGDVASDKQKPLADRVKAIQAEADLKKAELTREFNERSAPGAKNPLTPGETSKYMEDLAHTQAEADRHKAEETTTEQRKDATTATRTQRADAKQEKNEHEGVARDASSLIKSFGSKQEIEELKQLVNASKNGPAPLGELISLFKLSMQVNENHHGAFKQDLADLKNRIDQIANHG